MFPNPAVTRTNPAAKVNTPAVKPNLYCRFGCRCPKCGGYLEIEQDTLAHWCPVCETYELPQGGNCPTWAADYKQ